MAQTKDDHELVLGVALGTFNQVVPKRAKENEHT